jgi:endonuclease IV
MTLLPWPKPDEEHERYHPICCSHDAEMAEAALQRLRVAMALLADIGAEELTPYPNEYGGAWADAAKKALEQIGEIPE